MASEQLGIDLITEIVCARVKTEALKAVDDHIKREKTESQIRITLAKRFAKWAGGLFVILVGVLGWAKWQDFESSVKEKTLENFDKKYGLGQESSPLRQRIDKYINDSLVSGWAFRGLTEYATRTYTTHRLVGEEVERIKKVISDEKADPFVYQAALSILYEQGRLSENIRFTAGIDKFLADLVISNTSDDRKIAILNHHPSVQTVSASRSLLKPNTSSALAEAILEASLQTSPDKVDIDALKEFCVRKGIPFDVRRLCQLAWFRFAREDKGLLEVLRREYQSPLTDSTSELHGDISWALRLLNDAISGYQTETSKQVSMMATDRILGAMESNTTIVTIPLRSGSGIVNFDFMARIPAAKLNLDKNRSRVIPIKSWLRWEMIIPHLLAASEKRSENSLYSVIHAFQALDPEPTSEGKAVKFYVNVDPGTTFVLDNGKFWKSPIRSAPWIYAHLLDNAKIGIGAKKFKLILSTDSGEAYLTHLPKTGLSIEFTCSFQGCER